MSAAQQTGERVLFQDGSIVTITTARAVLLGTTYAMANITSVRAFEEKAEIGVAVFLGLFGFMVGALMIMNDHGIGWLLLLAGAAAGLWAYFNRQSKHWVRIGTSGAEANAVCSLDKAWTGRVVTALNDAIIARG
jgi:hypothetical protein